MDEIAPEYDVLVLGTGTSTAAHSGNIPSIVPSIVGLLTIRETEPPPNRIC